MKKVIRAITFFLALLLTSSVFCQSVSADSRYYRIRSFDVNVVITPDGSADVEERITYDFTGSFNGVLRNIDYELTDGLDSL